MRNDPVEEIVSGILKAFITAMKHTFQGIGKLTRPGPIIGFFVSLLVAFIARKMQLRILGIEQLFGEPLPIYVRYVLYWLALLVPIFYLMILSQVSDRKADEFKIIFAEIGFIGRDKKYPHLVNKRKDDKKEVLTFKSNIPLGEWRKAKERIETGMDCSIRLIRGGNNKKMVEIVTVPSDYKIPEVIRWNDAFIDNGDGVICLGDSDLNRIKFDLNRTPHVLAAGETGSGKSVLMRMMLWQMINKGCKLYMFDFKGGVEFGKKYEKYGEVIMDREKALIVFRKLVDENASRLSLFREMEVKNLKEYNQKTGSNLCRIGVFIDEIAEMLDKKGVSKEDKVIFEQLEGALSTLARLSRATGINMFLGVQRPDAKVLTGQIKNNIPVRISGRFADKAASEIVLGNTAAVNLPDIKGRFLYKVGNETVEFQSFWFDDDVDLKDVDVEFGDMLTETIQQKPAKVQKVPVSDPEVKKEILEFHFDFDD